ncbi:MAG: DUF2975 domain-containing protein [Erythrobacter sp.]
MTAVWTKRFVYVLLVLVALAALGGLLKAGSAISADKFHMVSYPASSSTIIMHSLDATQGNNAWWQLQEGTIRVDNHTWLAAARLIGQFIGLGLLAAIFWQLRGTLVRIGEGDVFNEANVIALRRIGKLLVIGSVLSISITFMTQYAILDALPETLDRDRVVHPSLSWSVRGVENIWMEYSPPIIPILMAMIAFITAGAFKSGQHYRADSESVI